MLDWSLARAFLEVAETGSLSAAARNLGQSQPTLGRQIRAAEAALGAVLFIRVARGLELTEAGASLVPAARAMKQAAASLQLTALGKSDAVAGTIRITASQMVSQYVLPLMLARLRQQEPLIQIELVPSDTSENLLFREADIALRMYRPEQLNLVTRKVGELATGLYAAKSYIARKGMPQTANDVFQHDFVGFDRSDLMIRGFQAAGFPATREFFATRCDHQIVYWQLVRAGCGIGAAQQQIADNDPGIVRVLPQFDTPVLPVWLTTHEAVRTNPRIRRVYDFLAESFAAA